MVDPEAPEFETVMTLVELLVDEDRESYTHEELQALCYRTAETTARVRAALDGWGLTLAAREPERRVRGFRSCDHDRWFGPGSEPTSGGTSYDSIVGARYGVSRLSPDAKLRPDPRPREASPLDGCGLAVPDRAA